MRENFFVRNLAFFSRCGLTVKVMRGADLVEVMILDEPRIWQVIPMMILFLWWQLLHKRLLRDGALLKHVQRAEVQLVQTLFDRVLRHHTLLNHALRKLLLLLCERKDPFALFWPGCEFGRATSTAGSLRLAIFAGCKGFLDFDGSSADKTLWRAVCLGDSLHRYHAESTSDQGGSARWV